MRRKKKAKRIFSLMLAVVLLCGMLPVAASAANTPFTDIPAGIWYEKAVDYAYANKLFNGTGNGTTFSPNMTMNRAMFVTVLARATDNFVEEEWQGAGSFTDVPAKEYYSAAVEWAAHMGIVTGKGNGRFDPNGKVTRQEMATFLYRYAAKTGNTVTYSNTVFHSFPDKNSVAGFAKTPMKWATDHKIINGTSAGLMSPGGSATRAMVAQVLYNAFAEENALPKRTANASLTIPEKDPDDIDPIVPDPSAVYWSTGGAVYHSTPDCVALKRTSPDNIKRGTVSEAKLAGKADPCKLCCQGPAPSDEFKATVRIKTTAGGVSVSGVEFTPQNGYRAQAVFANDRLYSTESASSIAKRTGAYVAVNGAFFQCYDSSRSDYLTTYTTLINNGKIIQLDNNNAPYKPMFTVDGSGRASIQFCKPTQSIRQFRDGEEIELGSLASSVGLNLGVPSGDGTLMMCTRAYGSAIKGNVVHAVTVDASGAITKVQHNASNVAIPATGYVLYQRKVRSQWDTFLQNCRVGDTLEVSVKYEGATTQDIVTGLSCGPTVVKNGKAYGNADTYKQEGFTDAHVLSGSSARMAIGVKKDGTVVIIHATCSLSQLSRAMLALGCENAMNLDGGASCALYLQGSPLVAQGRNMSNMLVFAQK